VEMMGVAMAMGRSGIISSTIAIAIAIGAS